MTMNLDRYTSPRGVGKFALIKMRGLDTDKMLEKEGAGFIAIPMKSVEFGLSAAESFYVLRAKDKFAIRGLHAYRDAVLEEIERIDKELALIGRHNLMVGQDWRNALARQRQSLREYAADLSTLLVEWGSVTTKTPD